MNRAGIVFSSMLIAVILLLPTPGSSVDTVVGGSPTSYQAVDSKAIQTLVDQYRQGSITYSEYQSKIAELSHPVGIVSHADSPSPLINGSGVNFRSQAKPADSLSLATQPTPPSKRPLLEFTLTCGNVRNRGVGPCAWGVPGAQGQCNFYEYYSGQIPFDDGTSFPPGTEVQRLKMLGADGSAITYKSTSQINIMVPVGTTASVTVTNLYNDNPGGNSASCSSNVKAPLL